MERTQVNITIRKDGRYMGKFITDYDDSGKAQYQYVYGRTYEEAESKVMIGQEVASRYLSGRYITVIKVYKEWLNAVVNRVKESSLANYKAKFEKHILPIFADMPCADLSAGRINEFINKKLTDGLSASYVRDIITVFKSMLCYAQEEYSFKLSLKNEDANGNNQDDIVWGSGTPNGNVYSYRVNISDHNNETKEYLTHIYAYDSGGNYSCCSIGVTTPQNDNIEPAITDISIIDMDDSGFTVRCRVTDNTYISRVMFPTWTTENGQDDIIWGWGIGDGDTYTYRVNISEHNGELDNYLTHIYAYDYSNNVISVSAGVTSIARDTTPPVISEAYISDLSENGYTVNCMVNDDSTIDRVQFPTWTLKEDANGNNQDDIVWGNGANNGNLYSYRVNISDHGNEAGDYLTHIYAYDALGNNSSISVGVVKPMKDDIDPNISDIRILDVDESGYTVKCKVTDNNNVSRVVFPTWTLKEDDNGNNQDDIIWGWGERDGNTFTYRVNSKEHNGEIEKYLTHIYAYDYSNNVVSTSCGVIEKLTDYYVEGDCNVDGSFNVSDVVLIQKWLLAIPDTHFANWKAADMCEDDRLDVFDLCLMKRKLIYG